MVRTLPQADHADLGLVEDDHTEDMRRAPAVTEALQEIHQTEVTTTTTKEIQEMTLPIPGRAPVPPTDFDLLAEVPVPPGLSAAGWRTDDRGHLVRDLSDGRIQHGDGEVVAQCRHCTVLTEGADECTFCQQYVLPDTEPAPRRLGAMTAQIDTIRAEVNTVLRGLPADAPLFAVTDVVAGLNLLRLAAVALDKAADTIEAADEVRR
ncbi:hypothetical protein VST63_15990 [Mycolicibacterium sp. 050232]|uniref:hypothetical protein n=1 Tax=Mycolicibacterium sp. 050232 TaxID=3113982 RepID=UPI002E2E6DB0|nr:hypothetical protein [Mycolicibacterium sp. 050232]MED5813860.1 hypothetical protein [Mycolicibacterium sp. 050232]